MYYASKVVARRRLGKEEEREAWNGPTNVGENNGGLRKTREIKEETGGRKEGTPCPADRPFGALQSV